MIHKNIWRPDTCECVIEYEWDDAQDENTRVHIVSKIIKKCPAHQGLSDKVQNYSAVLDENQRKNKIYGKLLEIPSLVQEISQPDGTIAKQLKAGIEYKWSFDKDRNLEVEIVGIKSAEKTALVEKLTEFGTKVKIK